MSSSSSSMGWLISIQIYILEITEEHRYYFLKIERGENKNWNKIAAQIFQIFLKISDFGFNFFLIRNFEIDKKHSGWG